MTKPTPSKTDSKETAKGCAVLIVLIIFCWAGCKMCGSDSETVAKPLTRNERMAKLFSAWDGSCPAVDSWIKNNIKDPDSYKHLETSYWDKNSHLLVKTKFTATNSFGGRVSGWCEATVDTLGNLIAAELIE